MCVTLFIPNPNSNPNLPFPPQKPALYTSQESLHHLQKKLSSSEENTLDAQTTLEKQEKNLSALKRELAVLDAKIATHEGTFVIPTLYSTPSNPYPQSSIHHLDTINNTSALNLDAASLQEYTKLRDVVSSRTFAEKTRLVSAHQRVEGLEETKQRMASRLESMEGRRAGLGEEKEELQRKRDMVCFHCTFF